MTIKQERSAAKAKNGVSANVSSYYQLHKFSAKHAFTPEDNKKRKIKPINMIFILKTF